MARAPIPRSCRERPRADQRRAGEQLEAGFHPAFEIEYIDHAGGVAADEHVLAAALDMRAAGDLVLEPRDGVAVDDDGRGAVCHDARPTTRGNG